MRLAGSIVFAIIIAALLSTMAAAVTYSIPWQVVDSGGGHHTSASYSLDDSVGQAAVGVSTSASNTLQAGFLYGLPYYFTSVGAMPGRALVQPGWNLISIPAVPDNNDPLAVFSPVDVPNSSMCYWKNDVAGGGYQLYGTTFGWTGPVKMGTPYWFLYSGASPTDLSFYGDPPSGTQTLTFASSSSAPHWVMFGHMQGQPVSCANIQFSSTSRPTPTNWITAYGGGSGIVDSNALGFSNTGTSSGFFRAGDASTFPDKSSLEPWYGYWMLVTTTDAVTMYFPAP